VEGVILGRLRCYLLEHRYVAEKFVLEIPEELR